MESSPQAPIAREPPPIIPILSKQLKSLLKEFWNHPVYYIRRWLKLMFVVPPKLLYRSFVSVYTQRAFITFGIYLAIVFTAIGAAVSAYSFFYNLYIPKTSLVVPAYLQFGDGLANLPRAEVLFPVDTPFPAASFLTPRERYDVYVELVVPESDLNLDLGNFMVGLELRNRTNAILAAASRPAMLRYKSPLYRNLHTLWRFLPLATGFTAESQSLMVSLTEDYEELEENPVHHAVVQISTNKLQIYSCRLHVHARFQGLRYFMYHWRLTTAIVFISTILFWEAYVLRKSWKFLHAVLQDQIIGPDVPSGNRDGREGDGGRQSVDITGEIDPSLEMEDLDDDEQDLLATDSSAEDAYPGHSVEAYMAEQLSAENPVEESHIDLRFPPRGRRPLYSPPSIRASSPPPYGSPGRYSSPPPSMYRTSSGPTFWAGAAASGLSYATNVSSSLLKNQRWNSADAVDFASRHRKSANGAANGHRTVKVAVPIQAVEEPVREGGDIRRTTSIAVKGGQRSTRSAIDGNGLRYRRRGDGNYKAVAEAEKMGGAMSLVSGSQAVPQTTKDDDDLLQMGGQLLNVTAEAMPPAATAEKNYGIDNSDITAGGFESCMVIANGKDDITGDQTAGNSIPGSAWSEVARPISDSDVASFST